MANDWRQNFLEWCRAERARSQESLAMMEAGNLRLHQNHVDISADHMDHLRQVIAEMDELIPQVEADQSA
jgi:hypothetical protein